MLKEKRCELVGDLIRPIENDYKSFEKKTNERFGIGKK